MLSCWPGSCKSIQCYLNGVLCAKVVLMISMQKRSALLSKGWCCSRMHCAVHLQGDRIFGR